MTESEAYDVPWGHTFQWPCGHSAIVMGPHDLQHRHFCPLCEEERRDAGCNVEYLDVH